MCFPTASAQEAPHSVDSEHLFGFTTGSDIGDAGDLELEKETNSAIGKGAGYYFASATTFQAKYTVTDSFRIAPYVAATYHSISAHPVLEDIDRLALAAGGIELKYRILDRTKAPFGLTISSDMAQSAINRASGQSARETALDFRASFDRELAPDRMFGAFNVFYAPSWSYDPAAQLWNRTATAGIGAAVVHRLTDVAFIGAELRYVRAYEGASLARFAGEAVFAGPALYMTLSSRASMTLAWNAQIAGHARGAGGGLDLVNFERHQVRIRFGWSL